MGIEAQPSSLFQLFLVSVEKFQCFWVFLLGNKELAGGPLFLAAVDSQLTVDVVPFQTVAKGIKHPGSSKGLMNDDHLLTK
ncbi:hypothetical protein HMPREF9374_2023 [Desmospora sp. 8437]|nr:hypothetical protein HMPREF9374_2023 [Desmospora sp. 8437]